MANLKSFSQYVAEAKAKSGGTKTVNYDYSNLGPLPTQKAENEPQNPISWLLDILSRPMRVVQAPLNAAAEETKKRIKADQTGQEYDWVGGVVNQLTSPIRGFASWNPEDQPSGDKIIENWTDAANMSQDPNYVDTKENANPWAKGIGGFAIDLATDPLMYIPGGQISAGLRGGVAGVKAVGKGVEIANKVSKTAEVAGELGAKAVAATEGVTKPFASNVIAGFFKGAVQGVPGAEKIGRFSRAFKPIGWNEWGQERALAQVDKSLRKTGLNIDDINDVLANPARASELAATSKLTAEQILSKARKLSKKSTADGALSKLDKANIWDNKVQARKGFEALPEEAAVMAKDAAEASSPASKAATKVIADTDAKPLTTAEAIARQASLQDARTFAGTILNRAAATEKIDVPKPVNAKEWFNQQVAKARKDGTYKLAHNEFVSDVTGKAVKSGYLTGSDIARLAPHITMRTDGSIKIADSAIGDGIAASRIPTLEGKLNNAFAKSSEEMMEAASTAAKTKASRTIMDLISKQPEAAAAHFGPEAITVLEGVKGEASKRNVVQYLHDVLSGVKDTDKVRFGKTKREIYADAVFRHHGQNIDGTNARAIQSAQRIDDEINLEAAALDQQGKNLIDANEFIGLPVERVRAIANSFSGFLRKEFLNLTKFVYRHQKTGVLKTAEKYMQGRAKYHLQMNTPDQVKLYVAMIDDLVKDIDKFNRKVVKQGRRGEKIAGERRATRIFQEAIDNLKLTYGWLNSKGITASMGTGNDVVHLYMDQVLETLSKFAKTPDGKSVVYAAIANERTAVPIGNILKAIVAKQLNPETTIAEIKQILKETVVNKQTGKPLFNYLNNTLSAKQLVDGDYYWTHTPFGPSGRKAPTDDKLFTYIRNDRKPGRGMAGWYGMLKPEGFADELAKVIENSTDDFAKIIRANEEAVWARVTSETHFMTEEAWKYLDSVADDTESLLTSLDILNNPAKYMEAMGKAGKAMDESMLAATAITKARASVVSQVMADHAMQAVKRTSKPVNKKMTPKQQAKAERAEYQEETVRQAKAEMDAAREHETSISDEAAGYERTVLDIETDVMARTLANGFQQRFNRNLGVADILHNFSSAESALHFFHGNFKKSLGKIFKKYRGASNVDAKGTTLMEKAWHDIINGVDAADTRALRNDLQPLLEASIGIKGKRVATGLFDGADPEMIQAYLYRARLDVEIPLDEIKAWADADGTINMSEAVVENFEKWIGMTDNPLDVLEKLHYAGASMLAHRKAAMMFRSIPGATKKVPTAGYTKVGSNINPIDNPLMAHLPEELYVHNDLVQQIRNMERIMSEKRTPSGNFGDFLNKTYMPILGAWKYLVTVIRPGHHIRNFISSESIQVMDQGFRNYKKSFIATAKVLAALRKYEAADFASLLKNLDIEKMPQSGDVLFIHPRFGKITTDMINEVAFTNGLYTPVAFSEDLLAESATGKINKFARTVTARDTKLEDLAVGASRLQNDTNRLHHLIQYMMNNGQSSVFKTWDDLAQTAAEHVRRMQPDGSMLTNWEARNMRMLFPFYAWTRLVTPVIFELIMNQPGRFMILPKASYNLAVTMGVNPQSIQDPFPDDQLFPEYLRDRLTGPVIEIAGKYYNIMPGFATNDIVNQFVGNPMKEIPTQLSPFLRVPAELLSGSRWGSQSKIKDLSDYVDSQLPVVGYLSNITGTSVTGSFGSVPAGKGFDPQYQFLKENKDTSDQLISFINWLSGLQVANYSGSSTINLAEIEKRNREAAQSDEAKNPF